MKLDGINRQDLLPIQPSDHSDQAGSFARAIEGAKAIMHGEKAIGSDYPAHLPGGNFTPLRKDNIVALDADYSVIFYPVNRVNDYKF